MHAIARAACRRVANQRGFAILEDHIYSDQAQSGARKDRPALAMQLNAPQIGPFQVVLVDDLSRLARNNDLMLSVLSERYFAGVRVVSVAFLHGHDCTQYFGLLNPQIEAEAGQAVRILCHGGGGGSRIIHSLDST